MEAEEVSVERRTVVTLEIPWNPEEHDHPGSWDYTTLLALPSEVHVKDWEDIPEQGHPERV